MVNVEEIQKINNLALDLMKQGLAQSRDDAITQAEKILKKKDTAEYSEMRETLERVENHKSDEFLEKKTQEDLSENSIKNILEQNTKFLVRTIKDFKEKVYSLEKEIGELRNKINYQSLPTVNDIVSTKNEENVDNQPQIEQAEEVPPIEVNPEPIKVIQENKKDAIKSHPRSGNFNEDDVSIEKFFYMGNG